MTRLRSIPEPSSDKAELDSRLPELEVEVVELGGPRVMVARQGKRFLGGLEEGGLGRNSMVGVVLSWVCLL
jgi:hypothetical protein